MTSIGSDRLLARSAGAIPSAGLQTLLWPGTVLQIPVEVSVWYMEE